MAFLNTSVGPERVQTFDKPLGTVQVAGVATSSAAFLIGTSFAGAPVNTPMSFTTLDQMVAVFGGPDDILYDGYYAIEGFFGNGGTGNTAIVVNVGSTPTAASFIGSAVDGSGLRALDALDVVGMVCVPGLPMSMSYLVDPAVIAYTKVVRAEFGALLTTSFSVVAVPKEISAASVDKTAVTGQFVSISGSGPYVIKVQNLSSAVAEISTFSVIAASGAAVTPGSFVSLSDHTGALHKFWFSVDGSGTAPSGTVHEVAVLGADTATQIAFRLAAAINLVIDFVAVPLVGVVTVTNQFTGPMVDATSSAPAEFTAATPTQGAYGSLSLAGVTPGMFITNPALSVYSVISAVDDIQDTVTVITNPSPAFTVGEDVLIQMPCAISYKNKVVNAPSRFVGWYYNNLVVTDESATALPGAVKVVSPVGHVCGVIARIDSQTAIGGPSHAPAGIQYAGIAGISGLSLSISERLDAGPLRLAFINRITSFPGAGSIIFGGYTDAGITATADEQLIQVMRSLQFIKASLDRGLVGFLWENFDPVTQSRVSDAILSFLRNNSYLFPAGLPEAQQFQVISVTPTQDELDQGLLRVRVQVKPNKAVRFIEIVLEYPMPTA